MHNIPQIHLGRNMCVHPFLEFFFLFIRKGWGKHACRYSIIWFVFISPFFYFPRLPETWLNSAWCILHSFIFFFYVRCFVQLNRGTFNRPVATPLAFFHFQFLLRGVQCFFFLHLFYTHRRRRLVGAAQQRLGWIIHVRCETSRSIGSLQSIVQFIHFSFLFHRSNMLLLIFSY